MANFSSSAKRSITSGWLASAFQTLLISSGLMLRPRAMVSTTALARGAMSLYSTSLAMAASLSMRPLVHVLAAVDRQGRAGDEAGVVGDQEQHAARDLVGLAESPDRDLGHDLLQHVGWHRRDHVGVGVARRDGVHGDALGGTFLGQRLGETVDAGLCGGIVHLAVLPALAVDRADVDDAAEA